MRIVKDITLEDFEAWSGGKDTLDTLIEKDLVDDAETALENYFADREELPTETEINDILWFERDWLAEMLGYADWDDLEGASGIYKDINGVELAVSDEVHWHDEAGRDEDGSMITFTIVEENYDGYFNLSYGDEDENPDRWAYYTELEIV